MKSSVFHSLAASLMFLVACLKYSCPPGLDYDSPNRFGGPMFFLGMACYFMLRKIDASNAEARP